MSATGPACAAAFLLAEQGVRAFGPRLGQGEQSRSPLSADDEPAAVEGRRRRGAHSQDIQVDDVAHRAHHFG